MKRGVAVADAGPLRYLAVIDELQILSKIFDTVCVPTAVQLELLNEKTPNSVQILMRNTPERVRILTPETKRAFPKLHAGESSAIQLTLEIRADALLIDDLHGRRVALDLGIDCFGTVGILEEAADLGLVDLDASFTRLRTTNFFASEALLAAALARHLKRRG